MRHRLRADIGFDANRLKRFRVLFDLCPDVIGRYGQDSGQPIDYFLRDGLTHGDDGNAEARTVGYQDGTVPVIKNPARRHNRSEADTVSVGQFFVIGSLHDL